MAGIKDALEKKYGDAEEVVVNAPEKKESDEIETDTQDAGASRLYIFREAVNGLAKEIVKSHPNAYPNGLQTRFTSVYDINGRDNGRDRVGIVRTPYAKRLFFFNKYRNLASLRRATTSETEAIFYVHDPEIEDDVRKYASKFGKCYGVITKIRKTADIKDM